MNKDTVITPPQPLQSLFAAQPIFDRNNNRVAVELLYRSDNGVNALEIGEELATTEIIYNLCSGISEQITQYQAPVFINVSAEFLLSGSFLPLEPEQVVIELVERISPSSELVAAVAELKRRGFRFALDDFEFNASWQPLIALADYIKIDILNCTHEHVLAQMMQLKRFPLIWLAERVETQAQYQQYKDLGFQLFQGYFLARPELVSGKKVPAAAFKIAELIENLFVPEPDITQLALMLNNEPTLVLGLLRIANSPMYRKTRDVSSVKELLMRLGIELTRKWVLMFVVMNQSNPATVSLVLTRAYFLLGVARDWHQDENIQQQFFLAGLLSAVDILYGVEPLRFIHELNVSAQLKNALTSQEGKVARAIELVKSIEISYALKCPQHQTEQCYFDLYNAQQNYVQQLFTQFKA